jgi:tight adherence protein C
MLILLVALFLVGVAFALVLRAALLPRLRTAETIETIEGYGYAAQQVEVTPGRGARAALDDVAGFVGALVARRFGSVREEQLRSELLAAGLYAMPPRRFLGYRILSVFTVPLAWIWLVATAGYPLLIAMLGLVVAVLAGWSAPLVIVRKRARRRLERIDFETPELIDVLVVTVEAGLGLAGSLQVASERLSGPLGDELRLALQQQSLGLPTDVALRNMLDRADTPAMRSFVRSVVQGEALGVSTGEIMRDLAVEMRKRRRAVAEERAQKAPIKIIFPLVLLIFPAMFVVLLAPAIFQFMKAFGG